MEEKYKLFEVGSKENSSYWDILRYYIYIRYYYPSKEIANLDYAKKKNLHELWFIARSFIPFVLKIIFMRKKNIILSHSRYLNSESKYYDKSAMSIIDHMTPSQFIVLEAVKNKQLAYPVSYDYCYLFRKIYRANELPYDVYEKIKLALIETFGSCSIFYTELNEQYKIFQSDTAYYTKIFALLKCHQIFLATGNPKAPVLAAKRNHMKSWLLQHQSIEYDEIDFSYPPSITSNSNILIAPGMLTFGSAWLKGVNYPAQKTVPIGTDYFGQSSNKREDGSILIISTIIHGGELMKLAKSISNISSKHKINYKLHPNEYHNEQKYKSYFKGYANVSILKGEAEVNDLIAMASIVVLIVSAVLYEAISLNKKVVVYKRLNYERQYYLPTMGNLYFADSAEDVVEVMSYSIIKAEYQYYKKLDLSLLKKVVNL